MQNPPQHLYKILSYRLWHATENRKTLSLPAEDNVFVHLATEEQLERTIEQFWSDEPQFVILKLRVDRLQGELVWETNPGGSTKFYHLYGGYIPFEAIAEANIVYRDRAEQPTKQNVLDTVKIGDSALRTPARELSKEEVLSPEIQKLIEDMTATMRAAPGVGLAAPQVGKDLQIVVIEDVDHSFLTPQQIIERDRHKVAHHVLINPRLHIETTTQLTFFEGCLSIPGLIGVVPRAQSVRVECLNEKAEPVVIHAKGWYARILQHEIDHLNATLCMDRAIPQTIMTEENFIKRWKMQPIKDVLKALVHPKES